MRGTGKQVDTSKTPRLAFVVESLIASAIPALIIAGVFKWGYNQSWAQFLVNFGLLLVVAFAFFHAIQGIKTALRKRAVKG